MNVLHIVNSFDPAGDVVRCVKELNLYSKHKHKLYVKERHPLQSVYQYEESGSIDCPWEEIDEMAAWCDMTLHQFTGWEDGVFVPEKPTAFRNINIYWNKDLDRFWSSPQYNAKDLSKYKLVSSSHVGAKDFLPVNFRWLPDLIPVPEFVVDLEPRKPLISFIKHAKELSWLIPAENQQNLMNHPHAEILKRRATEAKVVIDNVCDGHYGLAGQEAVLMGIPTIAFNHYKTIDAFGGLPSPFIPCDPSVTNAHYLAMAFNKYPEDAYQLLRKVVYERAVALLNPKRLVETYWDNFFDEVIA